MKHTANYFATKQVKNLKYKPKRVQTPVHARRPTRADKAGQKGKINMQHGLENTRKVEIKWNVNDTKYDTFYYPVPLVYGNWVATKDDQAFTQQEIYEAEENIMLYIPDEMIKKYGKELKDWKETARLAKNIVLEGYASELNEEDENFLMQTLYERGYLE